jgi:hypothetical protein
MASAGDARVARFLEIHDAAIRDLVARAYAEAGGHYSALAPAALRAQAATDAAEFAADLTRGSIDREAVRAMVVATGGGAAVADDINRMAIALERLFAAFVRERLAAEPTLADDLVRRSRNVNASFRSAVMAARLDALLRDLQQAGP